MGPELPPAHLNNYSHRFLRFYSLHPSPNTNGFVWVLGCKHEKLTPDGKVIYWKDTKEITETVRDLENLTRGWKQKNYMLNL